MRLDQLPRIRGGRRNRKRLGHGRGQMLDDRGLGDGALGDLNALLEVT